MVLQGARAWILDLSNMIIQLWAVSKFSSSSPLSYRTGLHCPVQYTRPLLRVCPSPPVMCALTSCSAPPHHLTLDSHSQGSNRHPCLCMCFSFFLNTDSSLGTWKTPAQLSHLSSNPTSSVKSALSHLIRPESHLPLHPCICTNSHHSY